MSPLIAESQRRARPRRRPQTPSAGPAPAPAPRPPPLGARSARRSASAWRTSPGTFARVAAAIAAVGGDLGAVDIARTSCHHLWRDVTVFAADRKHGRRRSSMQIADVKGVNVEQVSDRTFPTAPGRQARGAVRRCRSRRVTTCRWRTPRASASIPPGDRRRAPPTGVGAHRQAEHRSRRQATAARWYGWPTSDPRPRCPSWKARRCCSSASPASTAGRSASTPRTSTRSSPTVKAIAPGFGGINLEDISAPRCFEIERRLREELDIPVFHDDQHGTAVVVLAALIGTTRLLGRVNCSRHARRDARRRGGRHRGRAHSRRRRRARHRRRRSTRGHSTAPAREDAAQEPFSWWVEATNPRRTQRGLGHEALDDANVFIGLSGPGLVTGAQLERFMAPDAACVRDGEPGARRSCLRTFPRNVRADRDRAQRFSQPDQQRALLPRRVPRRARRARARDRR